MGPGITSERKEEKEIERYLKRNKLGQERDRREVGEREGGGEEEGESRCTRKQKFNMSHDIM